MNVREVISALSKYPDDSEVVMIVDTEGLTAVVLDDITPGDYDDETERFSDNEVDFENAVALWPLT